MKHSGHLKRGKFIAIYVTIPGLQNIHIRKNTTKNMTILY